MNRGLVLTAAIAIVASMSLTGCVAGTPVVDDLPATGSPEVHAPEPTSSAEDQALTTEPPCDTVARIDWRGERVGAADEKQVATGKPLDRGAREGAQGTAHLDPDGRVIGYTAAAGDAPSAIQDRLCIDYLSVLHFNGYWVTGDGKDIAPNDYLYLVPDPAVAYVGPDI